MVIRFVSLNVKNVYLKYSRCKISGQMMIVNVLYQFRTVETSLTKHGIIPSLLQSVSVIYAGYNGGPWWLLDTVSVNDVLTEAQ